MRILNVSQVYHPFVEMGGPAFKVKAIAGHMAARGHRVSVLATAFDPRRVSGDGREDGVEVHYLVPRLRFRAATWNAGVAAFCAGRLGEFDLVHIYGLYDLLGPAVARACRRRGIPYLVEPLGMTRPMDRSFFLKRVWHGLLGRALLRGAAAVVVTSRRERDELLAAGLPPARLFLRYNGLDLEPFRTLPPRGAFRRRHAIPEDEPVTLFLSRLIERKGAGLLIAAFADACPARGRLVIAGPEETPGYLQELRRKAAACGVAGRVIFPGPLYGQEKREALAAADVFALPSRYENFANAAAEAMACGVPVMVTPECGVSELVEGRAGLVVPRELAALSGALKKLLRNPELRAAFSLGGRDVAAGLSWERVLEPMERLYEEIGSPKSAEKRGAGGGGAE